MKNTLTILILLFSFCAAYSQGKVQSTVLDENQDPVPYANVILLSAVDSSMVKIEYTSDNGMFTFSNIEAGAYWITVSYVGYQDYVTDSFDISSGETEELSVLKLLLADNQLEEVTVKAKRPLLEMRPDKLVMNVAGSINTTGEDAYTLLKKSPGVVVDNNDNIMMLGKSGVQIYINGKPSPLSSSDLAAYLKTLSSDQIDKIEIITNPSAKYDAEGSAGIIDIKLLKNKNHGTNGSVNANFSQGEFSRYGISFTGNYRNEKWYAYTSLGAWHGENFNINELTRAQSGYLFDQYSRGEGDWNNYNAKIGLDHIIDDHNTIGMQVYFSPNNFGQWNNAGLTEISQFSSTTRDSILVSDSNNDWSSQDWSANLNYMHNGKKGQSFNVDLDYAEYTSRSEELQPNTYLSSDSSVVLFQRNFFTEAPRNITIATAKADYEFNALKGRLSTGVKYSQVETDNTFNFYNVISGQNELDAEQSNTFEYTESVAAAYVSYARELGKLGIQTGLRVENTNSLGQLTAMQTSDNDEVERNYTDFFPNVGLSYRLNDKNSFNLSYSRRLNRPSYQDLNPFTSRLDELTFEKGNPFLNPEYSNNIQLSHSWNYKINTSVSYTHTKDQITRLVDKADDRSAFITWLNLESQKTYSINISSPWPITEWWNTYTSITGAYTKNSAEIEGAKIIDISAKTFNIYAQHSFSLPHGINAEVSGWYTSPSIWGGNIKMAAMYSMDMGVSKSFAQDRINVKLSMGDVFNTQRWEGRGLLGDLDMMVSGRGDNQRVKVNVKYRFGNDQLKSRSRQTGLESEKQRIKGEG